ncbi:hypothetical protein C8F01DRAFT_1301270 [Mycena amicta]|nr:hypothetical protein C8F01DRAFT_1301270 [Mycena amicta]
MPKKSRVIVDLRRTTFSAITLTTRGRNLFIRLNGAQCYKGMSAPGTSNPAAQKSLKAAQRHIMDDGKRLSQRRYDAADSFSSHYHASPHGPAHTPSAIDISFTQSNDSIPSSASTQAVGDGLNPSQGDLGITHWQGQCTLFTPISVSKLFAGGPTTGNTPNDAAMRYLVNGAGLSGAPEVSYNVNRFNDPNTASATSNYQIEMEGPSPAEITGNSDNFYSTSNPLHWHAGTQAHINGNANSGQTSNLELLNQLFPQPVHANGSQPLMFGANYHSLSAMDVSGFWAGYGVQNHAAHTSQFATSASVAGPSMLSSPTPVAPALPNIQSISAQHACQNHGDCPNCGREDTGIGKWRLGVVSGMMVCRACGQYEARKHKLRPRKLERALCSGPRRRRGPHA